MGVRLKSIGMHIARYGLAIVLIWIGGMMFTAERRGTVWHQGLALPH